MKGQTSFDYFLIVLIIIRYTLDISRHPSSKKSQKRWPTSQPYGWYMGVFMGPEYDQD